MVGWGVLRVLAVITFPLLIGCQPIWVVHDRHGDAYPDVLAFGREHPGTTLVLIDYHPDVGGLEKPVNSTNWVGHLVSEGALQRVFWVSARRFLPGQRESRGRWLDRLLADDSPRTADRVRSSYIIADGEDLQSWIPTGPWLVSVDTDVWAHDAGLVPESWVKEVARWVRRHRPERGFWAISSAYQSDAGSVWAWTEDWWRQPGMAEFQVRFRAGEFGAQTEGPEEASLRRTWRYRRPFWPGGAVWLGAPPSLSHLAVDRGWVGTDAQSRHVLSSWADPDRLSLVRRVSSEVLASWWAKAREAILDTWADRAPPLVEPDFSVDLGLAVRVAGSQGDRGCLAWYRGVSDPLATTAWCASQALSDPRYPPVLAEEAAGLDLEISVFGPWRPMALPTEFRLGWDSLLLESGGERTLLQASVAVERGYSREFFLERLSRKAGLGPDGWKAPGVRFYRATTLFLISPWASTPDKRSSL